MESELSEMGALKPRLSKEDSSGIEPDFLPEYCHYRDEGCDLADSCLTCPFPQCIYDKPGGRQHWLKELRDREITRLFISEGKGVKELASMFGVSQRTIQRALKSSLSTFPSRSYRKEGEEKAKVLNEGDLYRNE